MKKVKVCYTNARNLGDAINPVIIRDVLHMEPIHADEYTCDISGIGSGLRRFFVMPQTLKGKIKRYSLRLLLNKPTVIWSAGFINTPIGTEIAIKRNLKIASVRGDLSRKYLEKILNREIDCTTGDGGLLCSLLFKEKFDKEHKLGIIPHRKEKGEEIFEDIHNKIPDSVVIDIEGDTLETIKTIAKCELIISSSLHGLIISDSFGIPNKRVKVTNKLSGDGFKFSDYYSSLGLEDSYIDLNSIYELDLSQIREDYRVDYNIIRKKQKEIIGAFCKYI